VPPIPKPPEVAKLLCLFENVQAAAQAVAAIVAQGLMPRCLELLSRGTWPRCAPGRLHRRKRGALSHRGRGDAASCEKETLRIGETCTNERALDVRVAQERIAARAAVDGAPGNVARRPAPFPVTKISEDTVVPRRSIATLLDRVDRTSEKTGIRALTRDMRRRQPARQFSLERAGRSPQVDRAIEQLFRDVIELRGHAVGVSTA